MAKLGDDEDQILGESMTFLFEKIADLSALEKHGCLTIAQCAGLLPAILTSETPDADAAEAVAHRLMLALLDVSKGKLEVLHPETMVPWSQYLRMIEAGMFGAEGLQAPAVTAGWLVKTGEYERWALARGCGVNLSAVRADLAALKAAATSGAPEKPAPPVPVATPAAADDDGWEANAWRLADEIGLKKWNRGERQFSVRSICEPVAAELGKGTTNNPTVWWGTQGQRSADSIRNALKGWQFTPPNTGTNGTNGTVRISRNVSGDFAKA